MDKNPKNIGEQIRIIRKSKGLTINHVAKVTGFTTSFISQFERGLTTASIASLQRIANSLDINLSLLFDKDAHGSSSAVQQKKPLIIRKSNRRILKYPKPENAVDYILTGSGGQLQVIYCKVEPNGVSGEPYSHNSAEEFIMVLHGQMKITVGEDEYILNKGDTITFSSRVPHGWRNIGENTLEIIWVRTPPTY